MRKGFDYIGVSVIFFCHDGKGNFLMQKRGPNTRDEKNVWDIGAGAIEFGDDVIDTLKREVLEEYSTDVLGYEFLGYRNSPREINGEKIHWVNLDFKVLVDREKAKNGEPHKFDEIDWFTFENLPQPLHSQEMIFLNKYKDKLCE